ncbi:T9SS type A sorting domain-containing protein [candidate division GN15 bacterium]|nr:T9SS type A sorting domain-containing protein [candidate division GN15 bacterium]
MMGIVRHIITNPDRLALLCGTLVVLVVFCGTSALAQDDFTMRLDTASAQPGERVKIGLFLENSRGVTSFELLIHHDPIALSPEEVTLQGTRAADFEYLEFQYDAAGNPGNIRVLAIADILGQPATPPMAAGDGEICSFAWRVVPSTLYSGQSLPIRFEYLDDQANTLVDDFGQFVSRDEITYFNGWVFVDSLGEIRIGDVNLNAVTADVGDAVLFTNYFMNPVRYPLDPLQMANTDVNADGYLGTVADLVRLINWVVQGTSGTARLITPAGAPVEADVRVARTDDGIAIDYVSSRRIGAALLIADLNSPVDPSSAIETPANMEVAADTLNGQLRALVYSLYGNSLPDGSGRLIELDAAVDEGSLSVELASAEGTMMNANLHDVKALLPNNFTLLQNYPNPFNPSTTIAFEITGSSAQSMKLGVYNALGQQVKILINEVLSPGSHRAVWDGTDGYGQLVASGVYFYRLENATHSETRKMLLLK